MPWAISLGQCPFSPEWGGGDCSDIQITVSKYNIKEQNGQNPCTWSRRWWGLEGFLSCILQTWAGTQWQFYETQWQALHSVIHKSRVAGDRIQADFWAPYSFWYGVKPSHVKEMTVPRKTKRQCWAAKGAVLWAVWRQSGYIRLFAVWDSSTQHEVSGSVTMCNSWILYLLRAFFPLSLFGGFHSRPYSAWFSEHQAIFTETDAK